MNDQTIPTYGRITECNVTTHPHESGLTYIAALTVQIAAADLTRIDLTRPITIHQENLPRLEWPGDQKPAPALPEGWRLADHPQYGRVVVTSTEPDDDGYVWFVRPDPYGGSEGYDAGCCKPDALTYLDREADTHTGPSTLAVGTVIESADDPRIDALPLGTILLDRNEEATTKRPQPFGWTGLGNTPNDEDEGDEPGPWTVLHIPKEADQ